MGRVNSFKCKILHIIIEGFYKRLFLIAVMLLTTYFLVNIRTVAANPWQVLQNSYKHSITPEKNDHTQNDPWSKLRAVYLPFTETEERQALKNSALKNRIAGKFAKALVSYEATIAEASDMFNIPPEIIAAVIMVESGGNPHAKAKTSSASGLMQTINATFAEARNGLINNNIRISESPFSPRASILAGSWYLNKMYQAAEKTNPPLKNRRDNFESWKRPLEYYYAGPGNGQKHENIIIIYSGGRRIVIDKQAYSQKVIHWAKIMKKNSSNS
jgi:soluble lytic murein transglycosylase-like protein